MVLTFWTYCISYVDYLKYLQILILEKVFAKVKTFEIVDVYYLLSHLQ